MKILVFAPVLGRGGCRRVAEKLCASWIQLRHEVWFLGPPYDEHMNPLTWPGSVGAVNQIPIVDGGHPGHPELPQYLESKYDLYYEQLKGISKNFDMIFLVMPWHTMRQTCEWEIETPTVAFLPDFAHDYIPGLASPWSINMARKESFRFAKHCRAIVFASNFQQEIGQKKYGMKQTHLIRKPGFVPENFHRSDPQLDQVFRKKYQIEEPYALAMHVYGHKDPHTLIGGYLSAKSMFPDLPKLCIAGIHSESLAPGYKTKDLHARQIQGFIKSFYHLSEDEWREDLMFLGYIPEKFMRSLYNNSLFVITASTSEGGVPGTICEAAAASKPVIYSDIPAHTEVLGTGDSFGYPFITGSAGELTLAIGRAWNDREKFYQTASALHELLHADENMWKGIANQYVQLV